MWINILEANGRDNFSISVWRNQLGVNGELDWPVVWATACSLMWQWRNEVVHVEEFVRP